MNQVRPQLVSAPRLAIILSLCAGLLAAAWLLARPQRAPVAGQQLPAGPAQAGAFIPGLDAHTGAAAAPFAPWTCA